MQNKPKNVVCIAFTHSSLISLIVNTFPLPNGLRDRHSLFFFKEGCLNERIIKIIHVDKYDLSEYYNNVK